MGVIKGNARSLDYNSYKATRGTSMSTLNGPRVNLMLTVAHIPQTLSPRSFYPSPIPPKSLNLSPKT